MGVLVGVIGSSHAPSISFAYDAKHHNKPEWKPFFDAYTPVSNWLEQARVDTLIVVYNDHLNQFHFDQYPTFALGIAETMDIADEGAGARDFPPLRGDCELGWHLAQQMVNDEFDPTICQEMVVDHGIMSVMPLLMPTPWPMQVVPIHVNVLREPLPKPLRLWKLGQTIARAIHSFPAKRRVAVVSTGGLSHQLHGQQFGFVNPEWDNHFIDLLINEPQVLTQLQHDDLIFRGGAESVEMMMWLAMRGALAESNHAFTQLQRFYWAPMLTGYGLLALQTQI